MWAFCWPHDDVFMTWDEWKGGSIERLLVEPSKKLGKHTNDPTSGKGCVDMDRCPSPSPPSLHGSLKWLSWNIKALQYSIGRWVARREFFKFPTERKEWLLAFRWRGDGSTSDIVECNKFCWDLLSSPLGTQHTKIPNIGYFRPNVGYLPTLSNRRVQLWMDHVIKRL
jgi:hypothetical protein